MIEALTALQDVFTDPMTLVWVIVGTALGITVGAIPGLTGAMLIALTLPLTYSMQPEAAMVLLVSMYVGSISGGLITATLLRMPGTPASVITTLDGYPMARSGRPGRALGLGIMSSFVGGCISWVFLLLLARPISQVATRLGSFDYFALVVMALVLIASVSGKSLWKGIFSGLLGILVTLPGESPASGTSRWTLGAEQLNDGLALLPVLIGLFAVSQILHEVGRGAVLDATYLENRNILVTVKPVGIFEVDRAGKTVWKHLDKEASHDADRLPNFNTITDVGRTAA